MSTPSWPAVPGVPAAGHVTAGGWWHPGRPDGCPKCETRKPQPQQRPQRRGRGETDR